MKRDEITRLAWEAAAAAAWDAAWAAVRDAQTKKFLEVVS
jgi:hypothetical protein